MVEVDQNPVELLEFFRGIQDPHRRLKPKDEVPMFRDMLPNWRMYFYSISGVHDGIEESETNGVPFQEQQSYRYAREVQPGIDLDHELIESIGESVGAHVHLGKDPYGMEEGDWLVLVYDGPPTATTAINIWYVDKFINHLSE